VQLNFGEDIDALVKPCLRGIAGEGEACSDGRLLNRHTPELRARFGTYKALLLSRPVCEATPSVGWTERQATCGRASAGRASSNCSRASLA
jgi:hypothetical protein